MHLQRLEIQGYKSFATRTTFEFDAGLTAIVGPNGSGKSNIMDALRWVLGETATRQMRAKRLEDVIFTGSEQRAPAGMAEVRLILDNNDGWLPLDFAEVEVVRRTHRSGDSEFLINGNAVRLRDIQDLFARGGLGPGSYALLGQGSVEEVLRLKPEERRGLIEEVAGVRRHRLQMEDARRRRTDAHENLERARLVLDEIEPRMRTLERQAKRARQHAGIVAELQRALLQYYGHEWRRLHTDLTAQRAAHDQRAAEQETATHRLTEAEAALLAWEHALQEARQAADEASAERRRIQEQVRDLEHAQGLARQREDMLSARVLEFWTEREALEAELRDLDAEPAQAQPAALSEQQLETTRERLHERETALAEAERALTEHRREAEAVAEGLARLQRAAADAAERQRLGDEELHRLEPEQAARRTRETALRMRLQEAEQTSLAAAEEAATAGRDAADAREQRSRLAQRYSTAAATLRKVEASRADRDRRLTRARDRLQMLEELQAESEGMQQGLRALFGSRGVPRAGESSGIPGVLGVLRHLISAPKGLERAVEAALEGYLDAVIFEAAADAEQTITVLLTERAGRILALPLDTMRPRSALALQAERGVVGVASALVRCDARHREIVDTLLGRVVVVEDLDTGRQIIKRGLGTAVTRDGHLLHANGAISGGRMAEAGSFTRENELRSLPGEIEALERKLAETADVDGQRRSLEETERELRAAEDAAEAAAAVRETAQDNAAERRADVVRAQSEIAALEAEAARAQARLQTLENERATDATQHTRREAERAALQARRPDAAALAALETQREQAAVTASRAAAAARAAAGEHEALRQALAARTASLARVREGVETRSAQIQTLELERTALTTAISQREAELATARQSLDAVAPDDGPEAQQLTRLSGLDGERRGAVQTAQRSLLATERALVTAAGAVHDVEGNLRVLREQMVADGLQVDAQGRVETEAVDVPAYLSAQTAEPSAAAAGAGHGPPDATAHSSDAANAAGGPQTATAAPQREGEAEQGSEEEDAVDPPSLEALRAEIETLRGRLRWLGNVNPDAAAEFAEIEERYSALSMQIADLEGAEQRMLAAEAELSALIRERFADAFTNVDKHFRRYFQVMFRGGNGRLLLTDEEDWENTGVEIQAQPPGKRLDNLAMLSGGERSLTAIALLFAMLEAHPAPFCVLDEVDAALDEANVVRFVSALHSLRERTEFVVITHNRRTIEQADTIYGITMGADSVSRVLSVRLADLNLED